MPRKMDASKRFFTGVPCKYGHISERWANNGRCIECRMNYQGTRTAYYRRKSREAYWSDPDRKQKTLENTRRYRGLPVPDRPPPPQCELCGKPSTRNLCLDHDHSSGKFRGWLCGNCNSGIGKLGDTLESLMKAVAYLQKVSQ